MTLSFLVGLFGSLVLVTGAAWPDKQVSHPVYSVKDWLFAIGGLLMLVYSLLNYQAGGPVFFVFLEGLVVLASAFMMLNVDDRIDTPILIGVALAFIFWSLKLFEGYSTVFFILGLGGIGLGYAMDAGTVKREIALVLGSILIAVFSYLGSSWIFFWLNVFFALFSGYYVWRLSRKGIAISMTPQAVG